MVHKKDIRNSFKQFIVVFFVILLAFSSNFVYANEVAMPNKMSLTVGSSPSERGFTWWSENGEAGYLELSKYNLEEDFSEAKGYSAQPIKKRGLYYSQVTLTDLEANTEYMLRVKNGDEEFSQIYKFKNQTPGDFNFTMVGDPQIGASGNTENDGESWNETLGIIKSNYPSSAFILSVGDQVQSYSDPDIAENEYKEFLEQENFEGLALAPLLGNHEPDANQFYDHFKLPNVTSDWATKQKNNYFFVYNNTLFLALNSNDSLNYEKQWEEKIKEALKYVEDNHIDIRWKVATFHHSLYSVGKHSKEYAIENRRSYTGELLQKYGIDIALMGHDHVYSRSYPIKWEGEDSSIGDKKDSYTDPEGILYITANSASGSKYYEVINPDNPFVAKYWQGNSPTYSNISVTDSSFEITTFTTFGSVVDRVKITKSQKVDSPTIENVDLELDKAEIFQGQDYTLPKKAKALMTDNSIREVDIIWDPSTPKVDALGEQKFVGTVNGWDGSLIFTLKVKERPADKTELLEMINVARAIKKAKISLDGKNIDRKEFWTTQDDWTIFEQAIKSAEKINKNPQVTQAEVDDGQKMLKDAIEKYNKAIKQGKKVEDPIDPSKLLDTSNLLQAIKRAKDLDKKEYTVESFTHLENLLKEGEKLLAIGSINQREIDRLEKEIYRAIDNLIKIPVDKMPQINWWLVPPTKVPLTEVEDAINKDVLDKKITKDYKNHWAEKSIDYVIKKGYMTLDSEGNFHPKKKTSRLEIVKGLALVENINPKNYQGKSLKDIESGSETSGYINWAIEKGIVHGYEDGTFKPEREISREEIAKILNQYVEKLQKNRPRLKEIIFKDEDQIGDWAKEDVKKATERGLMMGTDEGKFAPKSSLTKAEVAQIIYNIDK